MSRKAAADSSTVRQTIVTNLEAPRLRGVATKHFTAFQRERDLYEKQVAEKNREPGVNVTPTSYKASIDDLLLQLFLTAEWIKAKSVDAITEKQLKECVTQRASFKAEGDDLSRIGYFIRNVVMDTTLKEPEERVWTLHFDYIQALETHGLQDLPETKPHICIKHILKLIMPRRLRKRMKDIVEWRKDEQFDKRDFGAFMRELAKQAKRLDEEQGLSADGSESDSSGASSSSRGAGKRKSNKSKGNKRKGGGKKRNREEFSESRIKKKSSKKQKRDPPVCLNESCGQRHYVRDCKNTTEEQKNQLLSEYRARRKRENASKEGSASKGKVSRIGAKLIDTHTSLFSAFFCDGAVEVVVMADQGSDVNLIPAHIFSLIQKAAPALQIKELNPPHEYDGVAKEGASIVCKREVKLDIQLRIRHGTQLILRAMVWKIGEAALDQIIIGREVLQSIGCDNKSILAAACDEHDGVINVPSALAEDQAKRTVETRGSIASISGTGVFHTNVSEGDDGLDGEKVYVDLGEDEPGAVDSALRKMTDDATENGMSVGGVDELTQLLTEFKPIFE